MSTQHTPRPRLAALVLAGLTSVGAGAAEWMRCPAPVDLNGPRSTEFGLGALPGRPAAPYAVLPSLSAPDCALYADGSSRLVLRLELHNPAGDRVNGPTLVSLETSYGRLVWPDGGPIADADPLAPGLQVLVENGYAEIALESGNMPGRALVRAAVGSGPGASASLLARPERRSAIAAGLVEGVIAFGSSASHYRPADPFQADLYTWSARLSDSALAQGRMSFFYKGPVFESSMLSAGYDSINDPKSRSFADPRRLESYPMLGDAAITGSEALGPGRLWARVDRDADFLMYGDPRKAARDPVLSSLQLLGAPGTKPEAVLGHYESADRERAIEGFASLGSATQIVQEFASQGSGPYALSSPGGIEGTETVEMVARDRNAPGRIVWRKPLLRLADYSFEPFSGRILLVQPLPAFDPDFNPVSLRVAYAVDQGGPRFWSYGASGRFSPAAGSHLGAGLSRDENPMAPQEIGSLFGRWSSADARTQLDAEWARSSIDTSLSGSSVFPSPARSAPGLYTGSAWRIAANHQSTDGAWQLRALASKADPDFYNLSSATGTGLGSASLNSVYKLSPAWSLKVEAKANSDANASSDGTAIADHQSAKTLLSWTDNRAWTLEGGLGFEHFGAGAHRLASTAYADPTGSQPSLANGPYGGLGLGGTSPSIGSVTGLPATALSSAWEPPASSTSALGRLQWKATDRLTVSALGHEGLSGQSLRELAAGADYALSPSTRLYARTDWRDGIGSGFGDNGMGSGRTMALGVNARLLSEGSVFTEYRLRDTASGTDSAQASGVRNYWTLAPGFKLGAGAEAVHSFSSIAPNSQAVFGSAEWNRGQDWRASQKLELRRSGNYSAAGSDGTDKSFDTTLSETYGALRVTRDWSALGRYYALWTHSSARGDGVASRAQVGAAYRDSTTNLSNALFAYERREQRDPNSSLAGASGTLMEIAHTLSATADWHPSRPYWLTGRVARQYRDGIYENDTHSTYMGTLLAGRATWDFTPRWDASLLAASLSDSGGAQRAWGLEVGRSLATNLWLGMGYNFEGFYADPSLSGSSMTRKGLFIRLRMKFDERMFAGKKDGGSSLQPPP